MPLSFLVPAFLAGLAALAIPVLIHLSRRQTREPIRYPSLMFLQRIPQQTEQRRRIHRWPLLLLRALAVILLVLAFSRPFFNRSTPEAGLAATGNREVVVLLDRSYSMAVGDRWDRAVQAGLDAVGSMTGGDRGTVLLFDSGAESATESTVEPNVLRSAIRDSEPGQYTTRYAPALRFAARVLTSSPMPRRELVLISDFQASGWDVDGSEVSSIRLPRGTDLSLVSVAEVEAGFNVTVANADVDREVVAGRDRATVSTVLTGFGDLPASLPVTLSIGGRPVETRNAMFEEGDNARVEFAPITLPQNGTVRAQVSVAGDELEADNHLNFVLATDQRMGVLVLDGSAAERSTFYLERALGIGEEPGFRVDIRRTDEVSAIDLASNAVVVLNQMTFPGGPVGERLREFVEQGGGLVMVLGDNRIGDWAGVLPNVQQAVERESTGTSIGFVDTGHPIFESFAGPRSGDFGAARFFRYRPLAPNSMPRVLARYGDGGIALAERPVGNGRVMIWTSTLDGSWNDLALQPVFLPFLHQVVRYAAGYAPPRGWLTVGDPLDVRAVAPVGEEFRLAVAPDGERIDLSNGVAIRLESTGFYELRRSDDDTQPITFAVNVDPGEAEPTGFDPEEMRTALDAAMAANAGSAPDQALSMEEREKQQGGWWYLVVIALMLFMAETVLSNRLRSRGTLVTNRPA